MQTLREDGLMLSQALTQLPEWAAKVADPTVLRDGGNDRGAVRVVVNHTSQAFEPHKIQVETSRNDSEIELPLVIERDLSTIPTFVGRGNYSQKRGITFQGEASRLETDGSHTHKRQRFLDG